MTGKESEEPTGDVRIAMERVIDFVRKTGKQTFNYKSVCAKTGTLKRLEGRGVLARSTSEKDKTSGCNVYKLSDRELMKLNR